MMRVLIVDDHSLVRAGIALLIGGQEDMEPVGQAGTAAEAIKLAGELSPDIILLDVTMPGGGGLESLPALAAAAPAASVLMLSMHEDPNYVRAALGAGASGYVLKDAAYESSSMPSGRWPPVRRTSPRRSARSWPYTLSVRRRRTLREGA